MQRLSLKLLGNLISLCMPYVLGGHSKSSFAQRGRGDLTHGDFRLILAVQQNDIRNFSVGSTSFSARDYYRQSVQAAWKRGNKESEP